MSQVQKKKVFKAVVAPNKQDPAPTKSLYSMRNGKVNKIALDEFSDFKEKELNRIEESRKPKGLHRFSVPENLKKDNNSQNKLWYYDKSQFVEEEDEDFVEENEEEEGEKGNYIYKLDEEEVERLEEEEEEQKKVEQKKVAEQKQEEQKREEDNKKVLIAGAVIVDPRERLKPLPTLAESLKRKEDTDVKEKIIKKQIVTSSGRKLNLRI